MRSAKRRFVRPRGAVASVRSVASSVDSRASCRACRTGSATRCARSRAALSACPKSSFSCFVSAVGTLASWQRCVKRSSRASSASHAASSGNARRPAPGLVPFRRSRIPEAFAGSFWKRPSVASSTAMYALPAARDPVFREHTGWLRSRARRCARASSSATPRRRCRTARGHACCRAPSPARARPRAP